jgi:hypothetical protein
LRQARAASRRKTTPKAICDQDTVSDAVVSVSASAASDTTHAIPLTTASVRAQPTTKADAFSRARAVKSIRTIAMIGTRLIATPTA